MAKKLLVIGNGFDLAAGAKTSYASFFESDQYKDTKENAIKWIMHCLNGYYSSASLTSLYPDDPHPFNCWDLLFCMKSSHIDQLNCYINIRNWCDIEQVIHKSLTQKSKKDFSWRVIYDHLHDPRKDTWGKITNYPDLHEHNIMFKYLISTGWLNNSDSLEHFNNRLLDELSKFERAFGIYISSVTENSAGDYQFYANRNAEKLTRGEKDVLVDTFNYSIFPGKSGRIRHINGNTDNPIFGIDLSEEEENEFPEAHCFTKTFRRLQQDALHYSDLENAAIDTIEDAVVFGHSLNMMDFDYFNYLFTLLNYNTFDINKMGRIEFVFKSHSDSPDREGVAYADKVYRILNRYEKYASQSSQHILINLLRFSGKLKIWQLS